MTHPDTAAGAHSKAILLVAATEMWERFSYYGIAALFVLYVTAAPAQGGFGWQAADAIWLYGLYGGLAFAAPAVGGWISSSFLGERRCIAAGGLAIMVGHVLLGGPVYLPAFIGWLADVPMDAVLVSADIAQGRPILDETLRAALDAAAVENSVAPGVVRLAYLARGWSFLLGLAFVILGTALIKPTISSIVGKLYAPDDPRRVFAFTLFMSGIWAGAFAANLVAGTLGERVGWHYGFMAAALGMGVGLAAYLLLQNRLLGELGRRPDSAAAERSFASQFTALTTLERQRLTALLVMSVFTVIYGVAFYQMTGLLHVYVSRSVDRTVGGFEVPASWFLSVAMASFLLFAPLIGRWLERRARAGRPFDPPASLASGLAAVACGYVFLIVAMSVLPGGATGLPMSWVIVAYIFFGLGDVFVWPVQLAAVTALAPRSMTSFAVGTWYVTVGLGTYLAGVAGAWGEARGVRTVLIAVLLLVMFGIAALLALRRWLLPRCSTTPGSDSTALAGDPEPARA